MLSSATQLTGLTGDGFLYLLAFAAPLIVIAYAKIPRLLSTSTFKSVSGTLSEIFRLLFQDGWSGGWSLILGLAGQAVAALAFNIANGVVPFQLGRVVDRLSKSTSDDFPWRDILFFAGLRLVISSRGFGLPRISGLEQDEVIRRIKLAVYHHIMSLSADYHDTASAAELTTQLDKLSMSMQIGSMILFTTIPQALSLVFVAANFAATFGLAFAMLFVAIVSVYMYFQWRDASIFFSHFAGMTDLHSRERGILIGALSNWSTVSYFNRMKYEEKRYADVSLERQTQATQHFARDQERGRLKQLVMLLGWVCTTAMAIYQIRYRGRSAGDFIMITTYWSTITSNLQLFAMEFSHFQTFFGDVQKLIGLLALQPTVTDKENAVDLDCRCGAIQFDEVEFSYDQKTTTIRNMSFNIEGSSTMALVGETGGGKSTIIKLLCRRYDVSSGSIRIDGQDLRDLKLESLREQITIVPQEIAIFPETVLFNVRYGNLAASRERVEDACRAAAIHDRILTWPDGYDTRIGERGKRLSGGEMQRLAIARMLVKDSKIVIMDEAMSSLDSETDWAIQKSLRRWTNGKTVVMIAHRLSTIAHSDHILVVKGGQIVEAGRQRELIDKKGHYYSMWVKQNEGLEAGDDINMVK